MMRFRDRSQFWIVSAVEGVCEMFSNALDALLFSDIALTTSGVLWSS
jgi:hypothetical protein